MQPSLVLQAFSRAPLPLQTALDAPRVWMLSGPKTCRGGGDPGRLVIAERQD